MKVKKISAFEFDQYASNHKYANYYQSSAYAELMNAHGLGYTFIGFFEDDNTLIGATLILTKSPFMGFKYGYSPRGILIDYDDYSLLLRLTSVLKNYLFKEGYMLLKIDPLIILSKYDKDYIEIWKNDNSNKIIETLTSCGYIHCGYNNYFESVKPRWQAFVDISVPKEQIIKAMGRKVNNKINKAVNSGLEVFKITDINLIYEFIKKKGHYPLSYYQYMQKFFENNIELYGVKINVDKCIQTNQTAYEQELENNDYYNNIIQANGYKGITVKKALEKKILSDNKVDQLKKRLVTFANLTKNTDNLIIGGAIIIKDKNINILIEGYDKGYINLCPSYLMKYYLISQFSNDKYQFLNINAVTGKMDKENNKYINLNTYKVNFNPTIFEYIGEFNLVINQPIYALYRSINVQDTIKLFNK